MHKRKKIGRGILVLLIAGLPISAGAQASAVAEPPTPKVGEVWKYQQVDLWNNSQLDVWEDELVEIQADGLVFRSKSSKDATPKTRYNGRGLAPCRKMRDSDAEMCDGAFAFPLRVGGKHSYDKRPWRNGDGHNSADCEVKDVEKVTVPAGTFDAFRVDCQGAWQRVFGEGLRKSGRTEESHWYSPTVNSLVKSIYRSYTGSGKLYTQEQTELTEFTPK